MIVFFLCLFSLFECNFFIVMHVFVAFCILVRGLIIMLAEL